MTHFVLTQLASITDSLAEFFKLFGSNLPEVRARIAKVALIWFLAWLAYRAVRIVAARIIAAADDGDDTRLSYNEKRAATIAQLLKSTGRVVIILFALVATVDLFDVLPGITVSFGVMGAALAFGAQSIIKDILTGFFILVENQFTVGDVVETVGKSGTVERMTLRVVMLRDIDGTLHIIPNGQMVTVSNRTRGWSRAVVDVAIGYDSDVDAALEVLRDEARRFEVDELWKGKFDAPPEVMGIQSLGDNAINIRVMLRTQPGMQWEIAREFRRRVKIRLDKEGIDIPYPQRTVHVRHHGLQPEDADTRSISDAAAAGGA